MSPEQEAGVEKILRDKRAKEIAAFLRRLADKLDEGEHIAVVVNFTQHYKESPPLDEYGMFQGREPWYQSVTVNLQP